MSTPNNENKTPNKENIDTMLSKTKGYVDSEISKVNDELDDKQDTLTAGQNITIQGNVISASGGLQEVTASNVDSETATQGQVLTADGNGGASWQNASGGDKLYQHNITTTDDDKIQIINKSSTVFNTQTLKEYMQNNNFNSSLRKYPVAVHIVTSGYNGLRISNGVYYRTDTLNLAVEYSIQSFTCDITTGQISIATSSSRNNVTVASDNVTEL